MEVFARRRLRLIEMLGTISAADLSRCSGVSASYISRSLKSPNETGHKTIGEVTARKLEAGANKPEGWLDDDVAQKIADASRTSVRQALEAMSKAIQALPDNRRTECSAKLAAFGLAPDSAQLMTSLLQLLETK